MRSDYEAYFQDYMDLTYNLQALREEIEARPLDAVLAGRELTDHLLCARHGGIPAR
jgi:hypothetical protein